MPNVNTQFEGATLILPGAYYADNVKATLPTTPAIVPPMVFIGFGYGGGMAHTRPFGQGQVALPKRRQLQLLDVWSRASNGGAGSTSPQAVF